jgi:hypothetical protein
VPLDGVADPVHLHEVDTVADESHARESIPTRYCWRVGDFRDIVGHSIRQPVRRGPR